MAMTQWVGHFIKNFTIIKQKNLLLSYIINIVLLPYLHTADLFLGIARYTSDPLADGVACGCSNLQNSCHGVQVAAC